MFTLPEIQEKMKSFMKKPGEACNSSWLKKKVQVKYKDLIYFSGIAEIRTKVGFNEMVIISSQMPGTGVVKNTHSENQRVNIMLNEVRCMDISSECYPKYKESELEPSSYHHC